ncbi:hypothetical protein DENSPDRAFT_217510 [Dentipellis sp. KUC8613]|nr:hypothetical protein DENSPDRAFT_217510 [Dentipellis sp. KUC8613]
MESACPATGRSSVLNLTRRAVPSHKSRAASSCRTMSSPGACGRVHGEWQRADQVVPCVTLPPYNVTSPPLERPAAEQHPTHTTQPALHTRIRIHQSTRSARIYLPNTSPQRGRRATFCCTLLVYIY